MTVQQFLAWANAAQQLAATGIVIEGAIKGWIQGIHGAQLSEPELNQICDMIISNAQRRKALAIADATGKS